MIENFENRFEILFKLRMSASSKDIFTTSNSDLGETSAEQVLDETQRSIQYL